MLGEKGKNIVQDLQSKKYSWQDLKVPEKFIKNLVGEPLYYNKPSIIQSVAIPKISEQKEDSFVFQSSNGSGKTGAFAIPALMVVDPSIQEY